ncbi:formate dehydrogenase accessory sulfurtransferase FdhD [Sphingomonas sp. Tas61C01]|uniref:formate dehydrogenase accessory sulfurtransferase FdhD n=1 Tax=Sphingomonas sp. Tas61C01 TaxID=3458297 RepID=UPI00403E46D6
MIAGTAAHAFTRTGADGSAARIDRHLAVEMPVAVEFGGIGYAVLMATPCDLADLVTGFALSERLIDRNADIVDLDEIERDNGIVVRATLDRRVIGRVADRVRHRVSESSCGMCGIENLDQALRPLPAATTTWSGDAGAVFAALDALDAHQPLNRVTGAVHAAAACTTTGEPWLVREDVGRHNAFDKLIGAMLRAGRGWDGGFALLTSRCSYELVEKAVLSGCPMLATISAPTSLAVTRAAAAGLPLHVLARRDAVLVR